MTRIFSLKMVAIFGLTIGMIGCSKDDDTDQSDPPTNGDMPAAVADPADLEEGEAQFAAAGAEEFTFTSATCSWRNAGTFSAMDRKYAMTELVINNADETAQMTITFYVHDTAATISGGKLPQAGAYAMGLDLTEMGSESTEAFAQVLVSGDDLDYYYEDDGDTEGAVVITQFDNDILMGRVDAQKLSDYNAPDDILLNVAASFRAPEQ